ncbi:MAG: SAM-dependent methyltransferase, partial [Rhodococcus sp. (in: high G+C Gram-positive bacteria)]
MTRLFASRATLRRSVKLLKDFGHEQSSPDIFYGALARDSVELIGDLYRGLTGTDMSAATVLDVGGGPGYFADVFG